MTIDNTHGGAITQTSNGDAINVQDTAGATNAATSSSLNLTTNGTISGAAAGNYAINMNGDTYSVATVVTQAGSAITGKINLGNSTASTLTLGGGTITGAIDTAGTITVNQATFTTNGIIGGNTATAHIIVNDGKILDSNTNGNAITASNITLGSTNGSSTNLKLGSGLVTAAVDGVSSGNTSKIEFATTGGKITGNIGGVAGAGNGVGTIQVDDGVAATLNGDAKAGTINVGTVASAGAATGQLNVTTAKTVTGTVTLIGSTSTLAQQAGSTITGGVVSGTASALGTGSGKYNITGTTSFTLGGGGAAAFTSNGVIGTSTNSFAQFNIGDAVTANLANNVFAATTTVGAGASGVLNQTAGLITGNVVLGAGGTYSINGGSGFTGTLTGANSTDTLNIKSNYTTLASQTIGATTAVATVQITDGKTLDLATNNTNLNAGTTIVGTTATGGAVLNIGTGTIAGTITSGSVGTGTVNFKGQGTTANTAVIGGTKLATVNIYDGNTLTTTQNISATNINIGTSSTGVLTTNSAGGAITLTGLINGGSNGTGTLNVTGGANSTILAAGANIGATNGLAAINIATGSTLTAGAADTIKATQITLTGTGILNVDSGTVTGKIDGASAGVGTVNFTQSNVTNGNIGSGFGLSAVTITTNKEVNLATNNNSLAATTITLNGVGSTLDVGTGAVTGNVVLTGATTGSILNLNSTGAVSGTINGAADGTGSLNFAGKQTTGGIIGGLHYLDVINVNSGGNVTLGSASTINALTTTVNTGGALNFGGTAHTNTGNLVGAGTGTINLGTQTQTLNAAGASNGDFTTVAAGETVNIGIRTTAANANGNIVIAGAATVHANTKLYVDTSAVTGYIADSTAYKWLTSTGANASAALVNGNVTTNSPILTFTETSQNTGPNTRTVTAHRIAGGYAGVSGLSSDSTAAGTVLEALGVANNANAQIVSFLGTLDGSANATALNNAIKTATPQVNQSNATALTSTSQSLDVVGTRLTQLRAGIDESSTGMAAGGAVADKGLWIQGFGTTATQDQRSGVDGYNATTGGVALGADMAVAADSRLGLSFSYAKSSVDGNGTTISGTDIDSYQLNAYGSHNMGAWYTDGLLGAAYHNYNGTRNVAGGLIASSGDYNGETYTARAGGGYHFMTNNGIDITPNGSFTYSYNHTEGYTETGAGGLDNIVGSSDTQALIGRIGVDLGHNYTYNTMLIRPVVRAAYLYDFIGDQQDTTSQFTGGGATFKVKDASPARSSFDLGASLNVARTDNISFSADYDFEAKSQYTSHSGVLRARYNF